MHPANVVTIGGDTWPDPTLGRCGYVELTFKGKLKVDKKAADGKSGAKATPKGKEVSEGDLTIHWIDDTDTTGQDLPSPINDAAMELLNKWSPAGEGSGKPFELAHYDQGPSGLDTIMFEDIDGPKREPGKASCKLKFTAWSEPQKVDKKGTDDDAKDPDAADKWDKDADGKPVNNPTDKAGKGGFGGDNAPGAKP